MPLVIPLLVADMIYVGSLDAYFFFFPSTDVFLSLNLPVHYCANLSVIHGVLNYFYLLDFSDFWLVKLPCGNGQ